MFSVNDGLGNPLSLYVVNAPIRNLPATFIYCCPVTVLEWNPEHVIVLPPVTELESFVFHHTRTP